MVRRIFARFAVAAVGTIAIGCQETPPPTASDSATSGLEIGNPAPEAVQVPCVAKRGTKEEGASEDAVVAGTYCVCDEGTHADHKEYTAPHLMRGQPVVIGTVDWVTEVKLGVNDVSMVRSADATELSTLLPYRHKDINTQQQKDVRHLVRITRAKDYRVPRERPGCDPSANEILNITFCSQDTDAAAAGKWDCVEDGAHQGDTHVEN